MVDDDAEVDSGSLRGFRRPWAEAFPQTPTDELDEQVLLHQAFPREPAFLNALENGESLQYESSIAPIDNCALRDSSTLGFDHGNH